MTSRTRATASVATIVVICISGCGSAPTVATTVSPSTSPFPSPTPLPAPSISPTLKQTLSCVSGGSFDENANVSYAYSVLYVLSTYSDTSSNISCSFSTLSVNTHPAGGTCPIPVNTDGKSNDEQMVATPCGVGFTFAGFFNSLSCSPSSPYTYSFNVQAFPALGWAAQNHTQTVNLSSCTAINF